MLESLKGILSMNNLITPSVGSLVKKLVAINPDLSTPALIQIVRACVEKQATITQDFLSAETIDEAKAMDLARASLKNEKNGFNHGK